MIYLDIFVYGLVLPFSQSGESVAVSHDDVIVRGVKAPGRLSVEAASDICALGHPF